jgi:hypothetical protein
VTHPEDWYIVVAASAVAFACGIGVGWIIVGIVGCIPT